MAKAKWRKTLDDSMQLKAAVSFVNARNQEEEDFRYMTAVTLQDPMLKQDDFAGYLFIRKCDRRPHVTWTNELRMSKKQERECYRLIQNGASVWCGVKNHNGGTAILLKMDLTWVTLYEDGTTKRGDMPMLRYTFPIVLKASEREAKAAMPESIRMQADELGGFALTRYKG